MPTHHPSDDPSTRDNERLALAAEAAGEARVDAQPMKITFEFTGDCNLHCFFCNCEFGRNALRKEGVRRFAMDEASFRTLAEASFPLATVVNPTVIGEPLTFPHFDLLLDYAERHHVKLELITNVMLLEGERVPRLLPLLDRLTASIDGATRETFERCRTGARFERVRRNLENFRDLRAEMGLRRDVNFYFAVTLMRENIEELPAIVEWAHALDVDEVAASHLKVFAPSVRDSSLLSCPALSNEWTARAEERARALGIRFSGPVPLPVDGSPVPPGAGDTRAIGLDRTRRLAPEAPAPAWAAERPWCRYPWRDVFISQSGDVTPCCTERRPLLGNVFRDSWDTIWNGEEYRALRAGLRHGPLRPYCRECPILIEQGFIEFTADGYVFDDRYPEAGTES